MLGLVRAYRASLKSIDVEEPIDLVVHRPLAFVVAKLAERTPLSPNHLTLSSMMLGLAAGLVLVGAPRAAPLAGALLFFSQVVDCSDGMLARMRKSSSEIGRMLDGVADTFTLAAAAAGATWTLARTYSATSWLPWAIVLAVVVTIHTSSLHTAGYDHYKNFHLAITRGSREEDLEHALARRQAAEGAGPLSPTHRALFAIYLGYLKKQARFLSWFDPYTSSRYGALPPASAAVAAAYRRHNGHLLDVWRSLFGVGSLVFGFAVFMALGHLEVFLIYRLVILNAVFFGWLMPAQRRASRAIARELGLRSGPDATELRPSMV